MCGRSLKLAVALLAAWAGLAPLARATDYTAPDLTVSVYPGFIDERGRHVVRLGNCNEIVVVLGNGSTVPITRPFELEVFLGRKQKGKFYYYTGNRHRRTFTGYPAKEWRKITITDFKITKALEGQGVYIVAVVDGTDKISEQYEQNNQFGYILNDHRLDIGQPCP